MKTLTLTLVMLAVVPARTDAQQRIGGLALIGGGALMTLASGTCDIARVSDELIFSESSLTTTTSTTGQVSRRGFGFAAFNPTLLSGGPWPGSLCRFSVDFSQQDYSTGVVERWSFTDTQLQGHPGYPEYNIAQLRSDMRTRNPAMLYGGIAAIAAGVVLAILPGGSDTPAVAVQAGPHGVRLSRTFGF